MIEILLQVRFNLAVEIAKQCADGSVPLDLKVNSQAVAMSVDIAALIPQCFVAVSCVKLIFLLDNHWFLC